MKKRSTFIILLFFLFNSLPVYAASMVGSMVLEKGIVKLRRAKTDRIFKKPGQKISVAGLDEIQTGKGSKVIITLDGQGDQIELLSQTFFKIDTAGKKDSQMSMSIGKARFKVKKRFQPRKSKRRKRFRVRTANAVVGVKGTEFILTTGAEETNLLTLSGSVVFSSISAPEIEVEVIQNQVSQIRLNSKPTAPVEVAPEVRSNIEEGDDTKVFKDIQFGKIATSSIGQREEDEENAQKSENKEEVQGEETKENPKEEEQTSDQQENEESKDGGSEESPIDSNIEGDQAVDLGQMSEDDLEEVEFGEEGIEEPQIDVEEIVDEVDDYVDDVNDEVNDEVNDIQDTLLEINKEIKITITY